MLVRACDVARYGKHDLVVMLGCNDVPRVNDKAPHNRTVPAEYEKNLRSLLPLIKGEHSLFVSSFPVCPDRTGVQFESLEAYMSVARSVARECGYDVWDLFTELSNGIAVRFWAADGMHFNNEGHAMIASGLLDRLTL
jgi:lysophospholipase L1-like esterase